jgi:hypothetical protein
MSRTPRSTCILLLPPGDQGPRAAAATRRILKYVAGDLVALRDYHVPIEVIRIRPKDFHNARVTAALRARGIGELPALLAGRGRAGELPAFSAGGGVRVGCRDIEAFLRAEILKRATNRGTAGDAGPMSAEEAGAGNGDAETEAGDADAEEALDAFYKTEMQVGRLGAELDFDGDA